VFCEQNTNQLLVPIIIYAADNATYLTPIPIPVNYKVKKCFQMLIINDQLLILDNNREGEGTGIIRVFTIKKENV
jgi:hypothetical protein